MDTANFLKVAADHGLTIGILLFAVWFYHRQSVKQSDRREAEYLKMDERREAERQAFRDERDRRIAMLEKENDECKDDRKQLRKVVDDLQKEVRQLMWVMIPKAHNLQTDQQTKGIE